MTEAKPLTVETLSAEEIAIARVQKYIEQRAGRRGLNPDLIHGLDTGSATEAELTLTDLRRLLATIQQMEQTIDALARKATGYENDREYNAGLVAERDVTIRHMQEQLYGMNEQHEAMGQTMDVMRADYEERIRQMQEESAKLRDALLFVFDHRACPHGERHSHADTDSAMLCVAIAARAALAKEPK